MGMSKKASRPTEGVYYAIPKKKGGYEVLSLRADETDEPLHMFFWKKVLSQVAREYKLRFEDVRSLQTNYMAIPRGRVQQEIDKDTLKGTGKYLILHGGDVPISQIKPFVLQDFGLIPLSANKKVQWDVDSHEKMDPGDKKALKDAIKHSK